MVIWIGLLKVLNCNGYVTRSLASVAIVSFQSSRVKLAGLVSVLLEGSIILIWKMETLAYTLPN